MRLEAVHYERSGHTVVRLMDHNGKCVIAETGDSVENARQRLLGRLRRVVECGKDAAVLLKVIQGRDIEVKRGA